MEEQNQSTTVQTELETLKDIKRMMERGSRFISLSGLSGIAAGICALVGAWLAYKKIGGWFMGNDFSDRMKGRTEPSLLNEFYAIAIVTFIAAFALSLLFTWLRSRKNKVPLWGPVARRLMWNVVIPIAAGAVFLYGLAELGQFEMIAPGCLVFYGLALVNASKYTVSEIRWLGYAEILLGLINTRLIGYGLPCWAIGFGVLHIIYGTIMWWKYERNY